MKEGRPRRRRIRNRVVAVGRYDGIGRKLRRREPGGWSWKAGWRKGEPATKDRAGNTIIYCEMPHQHAKM